MDFMQFILAAFLVESLWETSKLIWQNGKLSVDKIGAIAFGEILAIGTGIDFLAAVGIPSKIPFIGIVLTGIIISRGSTFVHDLFSSVNNLRVNTKSLPLKIEEVAKKE